MPFAPVFACAALLLVTTPALSSPGIADSCRFGQLFSKGPISVTGAYMRATLKGAASAGGYLVIRNAGEAGDTLTGISSEAASDVAVHQMKMNGNVMEMSAIEGGLPVPAGGTVNLDPMGYHLMLTGLAQPFTQGSCVTMVLHFAGAGDLPVQFNVGGIAQDTPPTGSANGVSVRPSGQMDMSSMSMGM
jgi:copper(I)-binding protein